MNTQAIYLFPLLLLSLSSPSLALENRSTADDQSALYLTVYNAGRALVRDQREILLQQPTTELAFMDVAQQIMAQTVAIEGLDVLEQNYDFDLLSPQSLIDKNIGKPVRIARRSSETGEVLEWSEGTILSNNGGTVLQMSDGSLEILRPDTNYHMVFRQVPDNLRTSPTLSLRLTQAQQGKKEVELTYLTNGFSWQSDYVMQLDKSEDNATLDSWITLNNESGIGYHNAHLQLLAGDVNIQQPRPRMVMQADRMLLESSTQPTEQALHGYHLYTVAHKTTINNRQTKQIKLFSRQAIPVHKKLLDQAYVNSRSINAEKSKPDQLLIFNNSKPQLGLPLPKGTLRVYGLDAAGNKQFIGEDGIDHTALNEELEIKLGKSFDVSVERKTTAFRQLSKKQILLKREITINNGSKQQQTVVLSEIMPSQNWQINTATQDFSKTSPSTAEFTVAVPTLEKQTISYEVVISYP